MGDMRAKGWPPQQRGRGLRGACPRAGAALGVPGLHRLKLWWVLRASMGTPGKYHRSPNGEKDENHSFCMMLRAPCCQKPPFFCDNCEMEMLAFV